jgi:hypothetical protein
MAPCATGPHSVWQSLERLLKNEENRMETKHRWGKYGLGKLFLTGAALTGFLLFTAAPQVRAEESECQHRLAKADHRLHEAVEHHGWESKQAEHARHDLHEAREYCWSTYHKWWDEDDHRWHTDRDWDDVHGHSH